jgi:hypothetical protein
LYCSILIVSILLSGPVLHITSLLTSWYLVAWAVV